MHTHTLSIWIISLQDIPQVFLASHMILNLQEGKLRYGHLFFIDYQSIVTCHSS